MTGLLEFREKIKRIYIKTEFILIPFMKFLLTFVVLLTLNGKLGYMTRLDNMAIVLIVSLMCSFLPNGCIVLFAALFSLLHIYALSMEAALVGLCVYLVMFLLFFRFTPKDSVVVVLTPLLCVMKVPLVVPLAVGLVCGPISIISVGCGICVYYLLDTVVGSAPTINAMGEEETTAKLRLVIDAILGNKAMIVMIAAFAITIMVVYLIRRMSVDHSWTIAMVAGVITDIVILLIGDLLYDTNLSVVSVLLGSLLALAAGKLIEFFRFCVDYSRTEKVQFEDDEYYYYVKAVPKMTVSMSTKTVKKINSQTRMSQPARNGSGRSVVTERTGTRYSGSSRTSGNRGGHRGGRGRSVTINGRGEGISQDIDEDDLEELF
ncbi:MAG: hypothetical protein NC420_00695 [Eubacterium sp.]|nr:hypothetical protein [Eubacterium sp.]MCM1213778.1 hypothetical protein [Lachnospiraceae bacterium]MCM1303344.1 hypothetical protein [Butyrivibrio sp.]MCM1342966.1 hypothetical protein [Muribaculaceae bacterium]MCM1237897.1 hypothetical protein [Lachnospiraceae bacterium]